jgi:hypothetical protein
MRAGPWHLPRLSAVGRESLEDVLWIAGHRSAIVHDAPALKVEWRLPLRV